ncbi:MAG: GDSL-type esterase/lipase family protein, partial [Deltaproteobacteria bacterium]|nr:GDSL-type esterase/lipase family protein [Deltaproteobacteria bacterium]
MKTNNKWVTRFSLLVNAITLILLLAICLHYSVHKIIVKKLGWGSSSAIKSQPSYADNKTYWVQKSLFDMYRPSHVRIVMLGDSITHNADWNELLTRTDVANRGVSGDTTEGFLNRLNDVYALHPKLCFIMGGTNDFGKGAEVEEVYANYIEIVKSLQAYSIVPIIQSTITILSDDPYYIDISNKIRRLNDALKLYAYANGIIFVDVNEQLSTKNVLSSQYTYDGMHLLGSGYAKWRDLILPIIRSQLGESKGA